MTETVPDILARIVARKREELAGLSASCAELETRAETRLNDKRSFAAALRSHQPAIIAEIKQASPSKGLLSHDFQPARTAREYQLGGAAAISVLTDRDFFQGSLDDLACARAAVTLPVLRKDFTIDKLQILEAAAHGADAILLIAAILSAREMRDFRELAAQFGMAALVEVHDAAGIATGARFRRGDRRCQQSRLENFSGFARDLTRSRALMPASVLKVSESGIHDSADVRRLTDAGYSAFLVGEHLMKSGDPAEALRRLCS